MTAFEHVLLLLSFVYALAIAHCFSCIAALIRASRRVRFSATHALWLANALLVIMANWISFWDMRSLASWSPVTILFTFAMASINYLGVALTCPEVAPEGAIDLVQFHIRESGRYIGAFLACVLTALAANMVYGGVVAEWNAQNLAVLPMLVLGIAGFLLRKTRWRWIPPAVLLLVWIYYFMVLQAPLR